MFFLSFFPNPIAIPLRSRASQLYHRHNLKYMLCTVATKAAVCGGTTGYPLWPSNAAIRLPYYTTRTIITRREWNPSERHRSRNSVSSPAFFSHSGFSLGQMSHAEVINRTKKNDDTKDVSKYYMYKLSGST